MLPLHQVLMRCVLLGVCLVLTANCTTDSTHPQPVGGPAPTPSEDAHGIRERAGVGRKEAGTRLPARGRSRLADFPERAYAFLLVSGLAAVILWGICPPVAAHTFDPLDLPAPARSYKSGLSPLQY